jgi:hypothetical protein
MRFPDDSERLVIVGASGSGKTQAGLWHLSHRAFHERPWIVYNFKDDASIDGIPGATQLGLDELPAAPGVYVARPMPGDEEQLEYQFDRIWKRENIGLFVDEGYMVGQHSDSFRRLLIQGRSKHIPMIILSQRPRWMDTFVFTEANYWQVFRLQWARDRATVQEYVPSGEIEKRIPRYFSHYYDVSENELTPLRPVPQMTAIHGTFGRRLRRRKTG